MCVLHACLTTDVDDLTVSIYTLSFYIKTLLMDHRLLWLLVISLHLGAGTLPSVAHTASKAIAQTSVMSLMPLVVICRRKHRSAA